MTSRTAIVEFDEDGKASYVCICGQRFDVYMEFHAHAWKCPAIPRKQSALDQWMQKQKAEEAAQ
jgi:hypothetical protein